MAAAASSRIFTSATMLQPGKEDGNGISTCTRPLQCLQVRASQGFRDEGRRRSRNQIDDANLRLLKERMEVIRAKERLSRLFREADDDGGRRREDAGWTYVAAGYQFPHGKGKKSDPFVQVLMAVCGTFGFTVAGGTLCLCLASILVHLNIQ